MKIGHNTSGDDSPITGDIIDSNVNNNSHYNDIVKDEKKSQDIYAESNYNISKEIMLVSVSLFGILISLTDSSNDTYWARLFFVISLFLLLLGIVMIGISMLAILRVNWHRLTQYYWLRLSIEKQTKFIEPKKKTVISAASALKIGILFLILSIASLLVFAIIRNNIISF